MTASTVMEVFIEENEVRIELEIGVSDLRGFQNLLPGELLEKMGIDEPKPLKERLARFFQEDLTLRVGDAAPVPGFVTAMEGRTRVKRDEITGEPLPAPEDEEEAVIFTALVYPFDGRPETLSIKPPIHEGARSVAANIGFTTYHHGLPVMDFRYLGREETIRLDWEDPWYSQFENKNLWRSYRESISVFLYVEPYEVRAEIIVRPYDMQKWIDLGLEGHKTIPVDMQPALKTKIADFIADRLDLSIDGEPFRPPLDRINFLRRTLRNSTVIEPPEELDIYSATLGVIFVQPTEGLPQEATITWDLFSPQMDRVRAASTDEAGPLPYFLTPDDTVLVWKNFLKNPTIPTVVDVEPPPSIPARAGVLAGWMGVALLLAGLVHSARGGLRRWRRAALFATLIVMLTVATVLGMNRTRMTRERSEAILSAMLKNIYHAFDFRQEDLIYDTLTRSVDGDLLTKIYLETRKGLELASQGGARVKVKDVELLTVEPRAAREGFTLRAKWNVKGSVGHWGHVHQRTNQYDADFTIEPVDGRWKITDLEVLQEERIL